MLSVGKTKTARLDAKLTDIVIVTSTINVSIDASLKADRTKTLSINARLRKPLFGSRSLVIFPIGYIDNAQTTSKGSFTEPSIAILDKRNNELFEPNKGSNKIIRGHTLRTKGRATPMETREVSEERHEFTYNYENIWNSEYRIIKRFVKDISDHNTYSFRLVDFSSGVKVTGLATTGVATYNASLHNTEDFTTASGRGGNYICVRNGRSRKLRIGKVASVVPDSSISFQASPEGYGNLATAIENETYAYPLYKVFITGRGLNFKTTGYADTTEVASYAGPVKTGVIRFSQEDIE